MDSNENSPQPILPKARVITLSYSNEEIKEVNEILTKFQSIHPPFTTMKGMFLEILRKSVEIPEESKEELNQIQEDSSEIQANSSENPAELNVESSQISKSAVEFKAKLIESIGYETTPTDEVLYSDLIEIINAPLEPAPTIEIEKEVIKEVEKELKETEILLDISPEQKELLEKIARWRSATGLDHQRSTPSFLVKRMVFNKGTLLNEHGRFKTGITSQKLG